ncbi:MAG: hypothetical protein U0359_35485 [Byssovorax sp.]
MRPHRLAPALVSLVAAASALAVGVACGPPSEPAAPTAGTATAAAPVPTGPPIECGPPIGTIPKEDCNEIGEDFGALSLSDSLRLAGTSREADAKIEAIKAAAALATALKDQRVALCESYNKCKVSAADHAARDQVLASGMRALIDLWNKRNFSRLDQVLHFRDGVKSIEARLVKGAGDAAPSKPRSLKGDDALVPVEGAGLSFKHEGGAVIVTATGAGNRVALRGKADALPMASGHHYRFKVTGSYAPQSAPIISPGDEITVKLKYRASQGGDLTVALRSLEDPEAGESNATWKIAAGEQGSKEAKLTADAGSSGFYVGVGLSGSGNLDLDDLEILRGGKVVAAARAEADGEPSVKQECLVIGEKPLGGAKSFRCKAGSGDQLSLGLPGSYLFLTLRGPLGDKAVVSTMSLEGGRSVDATVGDDTELVLGLVGPGTLTVKGIEATEIAH